MMTDMQIVIHNCVAKITAIWIASKFYWFRKERREYKGAKLVRDDYILLPYCIKE